MEHVDSTRAELHEINELNFARIDGRFVQERQVTDAAFARVDTRFAELQQAMQVGFARMETRFAELDGKFDAKIERRFSDLLKWSFLFWCGAVGAIAALARVLR